MIFAETYGFSKRIQIKIFHVMLFNMMKKLIELTYIFFLLGRSDIREDILHMNVVIPQVHKELDQQRVDR